jgi:hypothetical protein
MLQIELTAQQLRPLQIIHFGIAGGLTLLTLVALGLPGVSIAPQQGAVEVLTVLSMVHVLAFLTALGVGRFMFDSQTRKEKLETLARGSSPDVAVGQVFGLLRRVYIIRLALLEAAAFLGIAVVLMGKMTGVLQAAPVYWLNLLSAVFFLGFVFFTFPTRAKIAELIR